MTAFVTGMETAADAPIPGTEQPPLPRIWLPQVIEGRRGMPARAGATRGGAGRAASRQPGRTLLDGRRSDEVMTA